MFRSIRGIFDQYLGWFSGKTSDLNPDAPSVCARNLIRLGGGNKRVFESAKTACFEEKYQWCLELTEALQYHPDGLNISQINRLQVLSLRKLASFQTSANGRNWYLTKSLEIQGLVDVKPIPAQRAQLILRLPLINAFQLLAVSLNYQAASGIDQLVLFHFNDTNENLSVHIRNGIAEIQSQWPEYRSLATIPINVEVKESRIWKQLIARQKSPASAFSNREILVKHANDTIHSAAELQLNNFLTLFDFA